MEFFYDINRPKQKEQSYGRLATQQRMQLGMAFLNPLRPIINESWLIEGKGNKSKAFGLALKRLLQEGIAGQYPDQYLLPETALISIGNLVQVSVDDVVIDKDKIEVYFSSIYTPLSRESDQLVLVAHSPESGMAGRNETPCCRKDGYLEMALPRHFSKYPFHLYLFVHSEDKKRYSKSAYLGCFDHSEKI